MDEVLVLNRRDTTMMLLMMIDLVLAELSQTLPRSRKEEMIEYVMKNTPLKSAQN